MQWFILNCKTPLHFERPAIHYCGLDPEPKPKPKPHITGTQAPDHEARHWFGT